MAQPFFIVQLAGRIEWRLEPQGLQETVLAAFPNWSLMSPLHPAVFGSPEADVGLLGRLGSDVLAWSRSLCLSHATTAPDGGTRDRIAETVQVIEELLRRLRYVSRQFAIPRTIVSIAGPVVDVKPQVVGPLADCSSALVRDYHIRTALTEQHLREVAALPSEFTVPVHADVLLDALEAHVNQDYRKALLYGAIAVESCARQQLESRMSDALTREAAEHRVVMVPIAGGGTVPKDPVYDALLGSDSFRRLLHEQPLYVLRRSLLLEKPDLYRTALRLYATRNKIAHLGAPPGDDEHLPLTRDGSVLGLRAAVDVVKWFGDQGPYIVWEDFVHAETAKSMSFGKAG